MCWCWGLALGAMKGQLNRQDCMLAFAMKVLPETGLMMGLGELLPVQSVWLEWLGVVVMSCLVCRAWQGCAHLCVHGLGGRRQHSRCMARTQACRLRSQGGPWHRLRYQLQHAVVLSVPRFNQLVAYYP
jgi:hypothetical protein